MRYYLERRDAEFEQKMALPIWLASHFKLDEHERCDWGHSNAIYRSRELVTSAGQSSKSHALKSVVDLEVSKTHLDTLTFIP